MNMGTYVQSMLLGCMLFCYCSSSEVSAQTWERYPLPSNISLPRAIQERGDRYIEGEPQNGFRLGNRIVYALLRPMFYDIVTGELDTLPTPWPYSWSTFPMGEFGFSSKLGTVMLSGRTVHGRPPIFCLNDDWRSWTFTIDSAKSSTIRHGWRVNRGSRHYFEPPCGGQPRFLPDSVSNLEVQSVDQVNSYSLAFRFASFALQTIDTGRSWQNIDIPIGHNYRFANNGMLYSHLRYRHVSSPEWTPVPVFRTATGDSLGIPTEHASNIFLLWDSIPIIEIASTPKRFVYTLDRGVSWQIWESGFLPYDTTFCYNGDMLFGRLHRLKAGLPIRVEKIELPIPLSAIREVEQGVLIGQSDNRIFKSDDGGQRWYDATRFVQDLPAEKIDVIDVDRSLGYKRYIIGKLYLEEDRATGRLYGVRSVAGSGSLRDSVWYNNANYSTDYGHTWRRFGAFSSFARKEYQYIAPDVFVVAGMTNHVSDWGTIDARRALFRAKDSVIDTCKLEGFTSPIGRMIWARSVGGDTVQVSLMGISQIKESGDSVVHSGGIAQSVDGGLTYQKLTDVDPSLTYFLLQKFSSRMLAVVSYITSPGDSRFIDAKSEWVELRQSADGGRSWSQVSGIPRIVPFGGSSITQTSDGTIVALVGGRGPWYSVDGGATFSPLAIESQPFLSILDITAFGDTVLALTPLGGYSIDLTKLTSVIGTTNSSELAFDVRREDGRLVIRSQACVAIRSVVLYDVLGRSLPLKGESVENCWWKAEGSIQHVRGPMFLGIVFEDGTVAARQLPP